MPRTTSPGSIDLAVDDSWFIDDADDKSGQVVFARRIKIRHLRRFAAEQNAAVFSARPRHALDDRCRHIGLELSGREVIQKKERACTLDENVVDAVIDQIGTDRVVNAGLKGEFQLGPDAVRRSDEYRLGHIGKRPRKHPAKAADLGQRPLVERASAYSRIFATARFALSIETPASEYEIDRLIWIFLRFGEFQTRA